jgi:hypothetical protein
MERAGEAMKQIHGKLNIDKVDETMYVLLVGPNDKLTMLILYLTGRNSENNMLWAKKLPKLLRVHLLANLSMRLSWMMSWQN